MLFVKSVCKIKTKIHLCKRNERIFFKKIVDPTERTDDTPVGLLFDQGVSVCKVLSFSVYEIQSILRG